MAAMNTKTSVIRVINKCKHVLVKKYENCKVDVAAIEAMHQSHKSREEVFSIVQ